MFQASDFPKRIWIEPTNYCNLKCPFCPHKDMKRAKGHMSLERFKGLLDEIDGHKLIEFWLQHFGESLLNPQIYQMIRYAKDKGIWPILLSTNCTLLKHEVIRKILLSGLDFLVLSLDGATKETFEKLRAGANFENVVENVKNIFLEKKEMKLKNPRLVLQIIYSDETQNEIKAFMKSWGPYLTKYDQISLKNYTDFAGQVETKKKAKKEFSYMPCKVFFENLVIYWNGDATPCCLDIEGKLKVGNVFESSIKDVWLNDNFKKLREAVNNQTYKGLGFCRYCTQGIGSALATFKLKTKK